jgi:hypothetical protein
MKTSIVWWIVGVVLVIGLLAWGLTKLTTVTVVGGNNATSTASSTEGTSSDTSNGSTGSGTSGTKSGGIAINNNPALTESYANSTYGFTISYPKALDARPFGNFHALNQNDWRYGATLAKRGTPVVEIPVITIDNQAAGKKAYPLFYTATVRVGVSTDVAQCYAKDDGYTDQTVTTVTFGGITWKKFIFGTAATMQYVNGASYRTVHNNKCYVVEQIQNGSSYRDTTLVGGSTDAQLKAYYDQTTAIAMSFRFR